jgi:hypothetical protein
VCGRRTPRCQCVAPRLQAFLAYAHERAYAATTRLSAAVLGHGDDDPDDSGALQDANDERGGFGLASAESRGG